MTRVFKAMALLLALVWVPLVSHCDLEQLPGVDFLVCNDAAEPAPHQEQDCQTDSCASVEDGHYKAEESSVRPPAPSLPATLLPPLMIVQIVEPVPTPAILGAFRDDFPAHWVFTLRQSSSPRAPTRAA